jgi:alpha-L-rhamnosidase
MTPDKTATGSDHVTSTQLQGNAMTTATLTHNEAATRLQHAEWITVEELPVPQAGERPGYEFRTTFPLTQLPSTATLAATAHGIYEVFVNDVRVGDAELAPGLTTYAKTLYVQEYDVVDYLKEGVNELRLTVTDGWYRGRGGPARVPDGSGTHIAVIAQLELSGGRRVVTDPSWEVGVGTILAADLMDGQTTDLTRTGLTNYQQAILSTDPNALNRDRLAFSPTAPVRRIREYRPNSIRRLESGRQIVDLGQNINGWMRLKRLGPAGTRVILTHGEALDHNGDLTMAHLAYTAYPDPTPLPTGQIDTVISRGVGGDIFEPRHTTHGFRYIAIDGLEEDLTPEDITGILVHTDLRETGTFSSSDPRLNELHRIAVASWRSNACDVPTDCPQRERWGYTGDFQIFVRTAAYLDDVYDFSRKWLRSLADEQLDNGCITNVAPNTGVVRDSALPFSFDGSAGWGDAATVVPWQLYQSYGNPAVLDEFYSMMHRWVDYAAGIAATQRHPARIDVNADPAPHEAYLWDGGFHWGEWAEPGVEFDYFADKGIIATAYLSRSADIVARAAKILGRHEDSEHYGTLAAHAADAWRTEYLDDNGHLTVETQANYVRGLAFGLIPERLRPASAQRLVELIRNNDTRLSTGFLSTPFLLPVLVDNGHVDLAYEMLFRDTEPSWMTMLERGATTIWESWSGIDQHGNPHESLNHYSKGAVLNFLHEYIAGIRLDRTEPGYRHLEIAPVPGGNLSSAAASLVTPRGVVSSSWERVGERFVLNVSIPSDVSATVELPSGTRHQVGAGSHHFEEPAPA